MIYMKKKIRGKGNPLQVTCKYALHKTKACSHTMKLP